MMVGVDVADVTRIRALLREHPRAAERFFTAAERRYCNSRTDPATHFAGTLAAKEAVVKALGLGPVVAWARRVEISRERSGAPAVSVMNELLDGRVDLSISHDANVAIAVAVLRPAAPSPLREGNYGSDFP